jgi:GMP synthase (glutamine-hydrolysing)
VTKRIDKSSYICIVDFGSQTAHLIGRRFRQLGIQVKYIDPENAYESISHDDPPPSGIVLSGGPSSIYEKGSPKVDKKLLELAIPVLGICYGWQLMAQLLGGKVKSTTKEYGLQELEVKRKSKIFSNLPQNFSVIMSHGDSVTKLPKNFQVLGSTSQVPFAAVADEKNNLFGLQFHPEAYHTQYGLDIIQNFAEVGCGLKINRLELDPSGLIDQIRYQVGAETIICGVSGGVDSTVAAFLIAKAVGKNLIPVYVDSGLMREGTTEQVQNIFSKLVKSNLIIIDAKTLFLSALKGITDPEEKRKVIGKLYIEIFDKEATKHKSASFLAQGTIYSDVIESKGSKHASHIKSHHNVGGLPSNMKLKLLEPLRQYYKDEVRQIGRLVGLPEEVVMQQPFPGPGYSVRIRGEVTKTRLAQIKLADQIVIEEVKKTGLYDKLFQCFAVMSGAYSTAVKGDSRAFSEVVAIRAYESEDVMTSEWTYLPKEVIHKISTRIVNEVPNVSRVVYDVTPKPPATMEWE